MNGRGGDSAGIAREALTDGEHNAGVEERLKVREKRKTGGGCVWGQVALGRSGCVVFVMRLRVQLTMRCVLLINVARVEISTAARVAILPRKSANFLPNTGWLGHSVSAGACGARGGAVCFVTGHVVSLTDRHGDGGRVGDVLEAFACLQCRRSSKTPGPCAGVGHKRVVGEWVRRTSDPYRPFFRWCLSGLVYAETSDILRTNDSRGPRPR